MGGKGTTLLLWPLQTVMCADESVNDQTSRVIKATGASND
jgi:hypothetical protein